MSQSQVESKRRLYATSIGSSVASMISKFFLHPIDTIKAKVQVSTTTLRNLSDYRPGRALELTKQTFRNEGIKGFFRGVTLSVFGSAFAFSLYMTAYEKSKMVLGEYKFFKDHPSAAHLISGFLAEIASCTLWLPIDIVKERLQVQSQVKIYKYSGPRQAIRKISLSQGFIGLYRAFGATLLFFGPFSAIFFVTYEFLKQKLVKIQGKPSLSESIICSAGAGAFAGYIVTPLELVKLRMQIQRADVAKSKQNGGKGIALEQSIFGYRNAFHGLYLIFRDQGIYALYRGGLLRILFTVPMTTLSLTLTQLFRQKILQRKELLDAFI